MSSANLNLFNGGSSTAYEHDDEVHAGQHRVWLETGYGQRAHAQRVDELTLSLCGKRVTGGNHVRHSIRRSHACLQCLALIEAPTQNNLL